MENTSDSNNVNTIPFPPASMSPVTLWRFEVVKTFIRFAVIGLLTWIVGNTTGWSGTFWKAIVIALFASNILYLAVLFAYKGRLTKTFFILKVFHYASLLLCLFTFGGLVTLTGKERSDYFLFYVFYLVMTPIVQIDFQFEETIASELVIVLAYASTLLVMGPIQDATTFGIRLGFLALIALANIGFSWLLKREHKLLEHANHRLHNLAITDPLTGLYNRRYLQEELSREVARARREGSHVSVIVGDLDDFKGYNDQFGHLEGDRLLSEIASVILRNTRQMDLVARFGGEEFVIMLPSTTKQEACQVAERIRKDVESLTSDTHDYKLTITQGIATFPDDARDELQLLSRADRAMYEAKSLGKNRTSICKGMLG